MKRVCSLCERTAQDRNLMCSEVNCPVYAQPLLGSGQLVGDVKIVQVLHIMKNAILYEGLRDEKPVWVKVANSGCEAQLRKESDLLKLVALQRTRKRNRRPAALFRMSAFYPFHDPYPGFVQLLPAYGQSRVDEFSYGQATLDQREVVYEVFEPIEGVSLRDYLAQTPKPFVSNTVAVIMRLLQVFIRLHASYGVVHGRLSPEAVWIREDSKGIMRPTLIDYGIVSPLKARISADDLLWLHRYTHNAYLAPELVDLEGSPHQDFTPSNPSAIDVYGVGLLLYEMLAGHPKFPYRLKTERQVRQAILNDVSEALNRPDEAEIKVVLFVSELARRATRQKVVSKGDPTRLPDTMEAFYKLFLGNKLRVPAEPLARTVPQTVWQVSVFVLLIVLMVVFAGALNVGMVG